MEMTINRRYADILSTRADKVWSCTKGHSPEELEDVLNSTSISEVINVMGFQMFSFALLFIEPCCSWFCGTHVNFKFKMNFLPQN